MSLLNKLPPPKVGNPLEMAVTGVLEVVIPSGLLLVEAATPSGLLLVEAEILSGVLKEVVTTGLPLPLPPPRMSKNLPSGLNAVPGTVRRKSQTTH